MKLVEPLFSDSHTGLVAFFAGCESALVGDNAFAVRTNLMPDELADQIRHYIIDGDYFCVFDTKKEYSIVSRPNDYDRIHAVLLGPSTGKDIPPPVSGPYPS